MLRALVACSVNTEELFTEDNGNENNTEEIEDVDARLASTENDLNNNIESKDKEVLLEEKWNGVNMITGIASDVPMPDETSIYYT